jgi:predicted AAA+ superfamily ATPase
MNRYLEADIARDLKKKIVLLAGPRQVGKTTLSRQLFTSCTYLNYDSGRDRRIMLDGEWPRQTELVVFDELHKMKKWKSWIKGVYDTEGVKPPLLVTGSARLETARKGGDSLAGRYFYYRLHPLSVRECVAFCGEPPAAIVARLLAVGGFPEPYLNGTESYAKRWRRTHLDTILRQDLLDLERVRDIKSIELLIEMLRGRVGSTVSCSSLANDLQVSGHTVKHWLQILEDLYVIFPVRPYSRQIARSILKEAKYYFFDTGAVSSGSGGRLENMVALALLKELHYLEDTNGSKVSLHYLRDKEGREVDFLALVDGRPVLMAEVKEGDDSFAKSIFHFKSFLPAAAPYQAVLNLRRPKEKGGVRMVAVEDFLKDLTFA